MRADRYLVVAGYYPSRARAQAAIRAGCVRVNGSVLGKASAPLCDDDVVEAVAEHPWVSRGGLKLDHALARFDVPVAGMAVLDVGASTGGFSDVVLARGAASVWAVDVGHGQLHPKLADDPRMISLEGVDARDLSADLILRADLVVCDASFISAAQVLEPILRRASPATHLVCLIKPQFEAGKSAVGRGGIVRDDRAHRAAIARVREAVRAQGWAVRDVVESPVRGGSGNVEYLMHAVKG